MATCASPLRTAKARHAAVRTSARSPGRHVARCIWRSTGACVRCTSTPAASGSTSPSGTWAAVQVRVGIWWRVEKFGWWLYIMLTRTNLLKLYRKLSTSGPRAHIPSRLPEIYPFIAPPLPWFPELSRARTGASERRRAPPLARPSARRARGALGIRVPHPSLGGNPDRYPTSFPEALGTRLIDTYLPINFQSLMVETDCDPTTMCTATQS